MSELPSPEQLAEMVSNVTTTLFGMSFRLAAESMSAVPWQSAPPWRTALLPIPGARPLVVAIASDQTGGSALGSAMFSCPVPKVDARMIEDSLSELANIVAGQIKNAMGLDQPLGLPRVLAGGERLSSAWRSATVHAHGSQAVVWVAITEATL